MKKLIIVSDLHGDPYHGLIMKWEKDANLFIDLGDSMRDDDEIELLNNQATWLFLRGNNDYWINRQPLSREIDIEGVHIKMEHGNRSLYSIYDLESNEMLLFGHSHDYMYRALPNGAVILNPGSLSHNRYVNYGTYARVFIDNGQVRVEKVEVSYKDLPK